MPAARLALLAACLLAATAAMAENVASQTAPFAGALALPKQAPPPDLAFGAYQRGYYVTAMREAMKRIAANAADGPALTLVGELYDQGLGVRLDSSEAAKWFRLAASHGDRQGTFELAMMLLQGRGVPKDVKAAHDLFEKAAAAGHPGALYNLGVMALEGNEVVRNFAAAADLFRRAAELGDIDAQYSL